MSPGEISLEVNLADLVLVGGGASSTLRFEKRNQTQLTIMRQADSKPAVCCKSCGYFLIITNPEYTDTECIVCKAVMPAGVAVCPNCGWTYREK